MFRQSPGRSQRSKGIKVKHVLQICFLLAICFWLAYQVKHSHDKKKEFDARDAKISLKTQSSSEVLNLGRKDLHPKVEGTDIVSKKQDDEAVEEEIIGEEENKLEEEQEQEDQKSKEKDDDAKEDDDEEIDEHEQEKSDADIDREEEIIDEEDEKEEGDEKENEENDSEDNNDQLEQENSSEEHDNDDGTDKNTQETREEHYKADDASSAVTHESQTITDENESGNSENLNVLKLSNENEVGNSENKNVVENTNNSKAPDREMIENPGPSNITTHGASENVALKSEDTSSSPNSSFIEHSNGHPDVINNTTDLITEAGGLLLQNGTEKQNTHKENAGIGGTTGDGSGLKNIALDQGNNTRLSSSDNKADSKLGIPSQNGETDPSSGQTSEIHSGTNSVVSEESTNSSDSANSGSSILEGSNATEAENSDSGDGISGTDNAALKLENPEIQTEGSASEDTAAE